MSPNGSFSTVVNTFVSEWGQGVVLRCGGGGGIRSCAVFWKEGVIRPIYEACTDDVDAAYSKFECLGYPRGQRKTSMFSLYATIAVGQTSQLFSRFPDKSERGQPEQGWQIQK